MIRQRLQGSALALPLIFGLLLMGARRAGAQADLSALFPKSNAVPGWALQEGPKYYSGDQLFDYMDGAAEIPKAYTFQRLATAKYHRGTTVLEVAIFAMGDAADAFGYYSARGFLERNPRAKESVVPLDHPSHLYPTI